MTTAILHNHPIHYKHLLFQEMRKLGLDFTVLFGGTESNIRSEPVALSQDLYKYSFLSAGPVETAPALQRIKATIRELNALKPKLLITGGYERPECWAGWAWARYRKVPVILWFESNRFDWSRHWWKELPKRLFVRGVNGAHVYGITSKEYLVHLGLDRAAILTKRAVVDVTRFDLPAEEKDCRPLGKTRILFIGRLAKEKNLPFLLRSFEALTSADCRKFTLTIVGTGPDEPSIREQIAGSCLQDSITLAGYVPQGELLKYLRDADFFILPSVREPWGLVTLEAMLARLPVIVSTQCGCAVDLVTPETGWAFSPYAQNELTSLLRTLPDVPAARLQQMGNAAHDLAVKYSPKITAEKIRDMVDLFSRSKGDQLDEFKVARIDRGYFR